MQNRCNRSVINKNAVPRFPDDDPSTNVRLQGSPQTATLPRRALAALERSFGRPSPTNPQSSPISQRFRQTTPYKRILRSDRPARSSTKNLLASSTDPLQPCSVVTRSLKSF